MKSFNVRTFVELLCTALAPHICFQGILKFVIPTHPLHYLLSPIKVFRNKKVLQPTHPYQLIGYFIPHAYPRNFNISMF